MQLENQGFDLNFYSEIFYKPGYSGYFKVLYLLQIMQVWHDKNVQTTSVHLLSLEFPCYVKSKVKVSFFL